MKNLITIQQIKKEGFKKRDTIWAVIFWNPLAARLIWLIANFTKITPNNLTTISLIIGLLSGIFFIKGDLILGAILFQISYLFDAMDGKLARVQKKSSNIGELYDNITDRIKIFVWTTSLFIGITFNFPQYYSILLTVILFGYSYLSLTDSNLWLFYEKFKVNKNITKKSEDLNQNNIFIRICDKLGIQPIPTDIEFACFIFTIIPILIQTQMVNAEVIQIILIIFICSKLLISSILINYIYKKVKGL
jgi:hypothetical protein